MTRLKCRGRTTTKSSELLPAADRFFSLHCDLLPVEALLDVDPVAEADGTEAFVELAPDALPVWTAVPEGNGTLDTGGVTSSWIEARFESAGPGKVYVDPESNTWSTLKHRVNESQTRMEPPKELTVGSKMPGSLSL